MALRLLYRRLADPSPRKEEHPMKRALACLIFSFVVAGCGGGGGGDGTGGNGGAGGGGAAGSGGSGGGGGGGQSVADLASHGGAVDMSLPNVDAAGTKFCCGKPGDAGNEQGVGKYCVDSGACSGLQALFCATLGNPDSHFCTRPCSMGENCGTAATCQCQGSSCGCVPDACISMPMSC
jgi:hypothetical protein